MLKQPVPGDHFMREEGKSILVGAPVTRQARSLFRGSISGRARKAPIYFLAKLLSQSKVQDLEMALGRGPDILRLQIAMYDMLGMGKIERLRERSKDQANLFQGQARTPPKHFTKGFSRNVFKDDKRLLSVKYEVKNRGTSWMRDIGPNPCLFDEGLS